MSPGAVPTVSLVLAACNQERHLGPAVAAALSQDHPGLEIVLSDDASTDRSYALMEAAAATYRGPHRVILGRSANRLGAVAHLNVAIGRSTGEIVILAEGDGVSHRGRARLLADALLVSGAAIAFCGARHLDTHGTAAGASAEGKPARSFFLTDLVDDPRRHGFDGASPALRREVFTAFGPLDPQRTGRIWPQVLALRGAVLGGCRVLGDTLVDLQGGGEITRDREAALADGLALRLAQAEDLRRFLQTHDDRPELRAAYLRLRSRIVLMLYDWTLARNAKRLSGLRAVWEPHARATGAGAS